MQQAIVHFIINKIITFIIEKNFHLVMLVTASIASS
jgi:hypothetical protein